MTLKSFMMLSVGLAAISHCALTHASLTIVAVQGGGPVAGVNYVTFDTLPPGGAGGFAQNTAGSADAGGGITVSFAPDAQAVQGASSGQYAAPFLSGSNGAFFDGQPNGADATTYLTSGKDGQPNVGAKAILEFSSYQSYLGLLWGSVDTFNTLEFFDGDTSVGIVTGSQVTPAATGDQGANGTFYVNIDSSLPFNKVVASSSEYAFEFDNVAYSANRIVPEATTIAIWSTLGAIGFLAYRRRQLA